MLFPKALEEKGQGMIDIDIFGDTGTVVKTDAMIKRLSVFHSILHSM